MVLSVRQLKLTLNFIHLVRCLYWIVIIVLTPCSVQLGWWLLRFAASKLCGNASESLSSFWAEAVLVWTMEPFILLISYSPPTKWATNLCKCVWEYKCLKSLLNYLLDNDDSYTYYEFRLKENEPSINLNIQHHKIPNLFWSTYIWDVVSPLPTQPSLHSRYSQGRTYKLDSFMFDIISYNIISSYFSVCNLIFLECRFRMSRPV